MPRSINELHLNPKLGDANYVSSEFSLRLFSPDMKYFLLLCYEVLVRKYYLRKEKLKGISKSETSIFDAQMITMMVKTGDRGNKFVRKKTTRCRRY